MGPSESHIDNLKSRSFFYDKMRILKQKYYLSDSNVMKYDFSLNESEITNYNYINYNKALGIHDVQYLKSKYKEKVSNYLKRIEILNKLFLNLYSLSKDKDIDHFAIKRQASNQIKHEHFKWSKSSILVQLTQTLHQI